MNAVLRSHGGIMRTLALFLGLLTISNFAFADVSDQDFANLVSRVEKLEKSVTNRSWTCSIKCVMYTSPNKTYKFSTVVVGASENLKDAFESTTNKCDAYFTNVKATQGYSFYGGTYDEDNNADIRRNCIHAG